MPPWTRLCGPSKKPLHNKAAVLDHLRACAGPARADGDVILRLVELEAGQRGRP